MIVKPLSRIIQEFDASRFTVLGCPGADGLGAGALTIFHEGLARAGGDFIVVLGDASPIGRDPYYARTAEFMDAVSPKPVHVLRGNHDGPDYEEHFGMANRAFLSENFLLLMLDNSTRHFSDETLTFLRGTMAMVESENVMVAFHIPPPNRFSGHSMTKEAWQRFEDAVGVWRNRISLLLCSHARCAFEDDVDGLRLVATGGAGAGLYGTDRLTAQSHHALEVSVDAEGRAAYTIRPLARPMEPRDRTAPVAAAVRSLYDACRRDRTELLFRAEAAEKSGERFLPRLLRAGAAQALLHAGSLRGVSARDENLLYCITEEAESGRDSFAALLRRAENDCGDADAEKRVFLCRSCAAVSAASDFSTYCPVCGAPGHFLAEME